MKSLFAVAIMLLFSGEAFAHHSFSAEFDSDRKVTVTGTITEIRFRNPHVQYFIEVDTNGNAERWIVAGHTMILMRRSGISADTVTIGDEITVSGYAGRNGAQKVYMETLDAPDGERFTIYGEAIRRADYAPVTRADDHPNSLLIVQLLGDWAFDVDKEMPGVPLHLEFVRDDDGLKAILDNEVIDVTVGQDSFNLTLSRENLAGFPAQLLLNGRIVDDMITGEIDMITGYSNFPELDAESFTGIRTSPDFWAEKDSAPMSPVDMTGVWERAIVLGPIGRTNPHLNAAGKSRHEEFQKGAYDPLLRCMSAGPMRRQARRGNMEILATTNRLTILYANSNGIRRIWLGRKTHDPNREHSEMGESIAKWDGSTLVIDTQNLSASVLTQNMEPISSNARVVERFWLDEANDLVMEATLFDPTYYERPVVRRLKWTRTDDQEVLFPPCDPDSFYRGLQFDDALDSYFENHPARDGQ